jgi:hypothetical protein
MDITTVEEFYQAIAERRVQERAAVRAFFEATAAGDVQKLADAFDAIEFQCGWTEVMIALARLPEISGRMKKAWLSSWVFSGDHIRSEVDNDLVLIKALWKLLPPYRGPSLRLYRGESMFNRRRRTYGLSWTSKVVIATDFARGVYQTSDGGSVLLQTDAPTAAIICAPRFHTRQINYGEFEYLVDRRKLTAVTVVERFAQRPVQSTRNTVTEKSPRDDEAGNPPIS